MPRIFCHTFPAVDWVTGLTADPLTVCGVRVSAFVPHATALKSLLLADETARADRYHRVADRNRFLVARSVLRLLLGHYTGQPPAMIRFERDIRKKPVLADVPACRFNVSHAGDWVLFAVGTTDVGIDTEEMSVTAVLEPVLGHSFSADERRFIGDVATAGGRDRFYRLWTRKEALVKATGRGIDDRFGRVPCLDGWHDTPADHIGSARDWTVASFGLADGYAAAVAFTNDCKPVFCLLSPDVFGLGPL